MPFSFDRKLPQASSIKSIQSPLHPAVEKPQKPKQHSPLPVRKVELHHQAQDINLLEMLFFYKSLRPPLMRRTILPPGSKGVRAHFCGKPVLRRAYHPGQKAKPDSQGGKKGALSTRFPLSHCAVWISEAFTIKTRPCTVSVSGSSTSNETPQYSIPLE